MIATAVVLIGNGCAEQQPQDSPRKMTVVVVSGILDSTGNEITVLRPPKRLVIPEGPLPSPVEGRYDLEVSYESGARLAISFTGVVADDAGHAQFGFFEVMVPADQAIETMTILDTRAARVLATLRGADIVD